MSDPTWLTVLVDQRLALIEQALPNFEGVTLIMTPLTEPGEDSKIALEHWERSCDNCSTYCRPEQKFYTGSLTRHLKDGRQVLITFGVCDNCRTTFEEE